MTACYDGPIDLSSNGLVFFKEEVEDALRDGPYEVTEDATFYVCGVLSRWVQLGGRGEEALDRSLTLMLGEALEAPASERVVRLREVGDAILYLSGFFGDHFERRGVGLGYVGVLGARAYGGAAELLQRRAGVAGVYRELATKFQVFVEVVSTVARSLRMRGVRDDRSLLRLYEQWMRTGSSVEAGELLARGVMPSKAPKGLS